MLKEIELEEVLQNLYENRPVYMMLKLEKENAIEDLFGADAFYTETEELEQQAGGVETKEPEPTFITAVVPKKQPEKENVIDKFMPLVSNKKVEITNDTGNKTWDWAEVEQMIKEGKTAADVAKYYGMNYQTVWGRISRKGLL